MSIWVGTRLRGRAGLVDVATALGALAVMLALPMTHRSPFGGLTLTGLVLTLLASAALVVRRRWPVTALAVCVAAAAAQTLVVHSRSPMVVAVGIGLVTLVVTDDRRPSEASAVAALVGVLAVPAVQFLRVRDGWWTNLSSVLWLVLCLAVGAAMRNRHQHLVALEERARRAEYTRDEEARRRVAEERLRIARELHDVVAHQIALVGVQAQVAELMLTADPDRARIALGHVQAAGRTVLGELTVMLDVLRQPEEGTPVGTPQPIEPAPSLDRLGDLLSAFRAAGMPVQTEVPSPAPVLAPAVDLSAFRIIQEALTNAYKHATGSDVQLRLRVGAGRLLIEVDNGPAPGGSPGEAAPGTGHGLIGMRERAAALGGTCLAEPRGGGYRVRAEIPASGKESDDPGARGRRPGTDPGGILGAGRVGAGSGGGRAGG